jgi:hypothetical protein
MEVAGRLNTLETLEPASNVATWDTGRGALLNIVRTRVLIAETENVPMQPSTCRILRYVFSANLYSTEVLAVFMMRL